MPQDLIQLCVNTIRTLSMDGVQKANSGHPGMPMGMADTAYVLWTQFLNHNPADPAWPDRDRFVLSAGHGSMLLYSLLYLTGYDLPLEQLQRFRQWGSLTPGHPEYGDTPGVETTTGPLGQGFATGVGMALAERLLAGHFNRPGFEIVDHYTYAIVSDGDLMEGISHEAASIAGHLGLGKLIYLYDDNQITIEGSTALTFSEDVHRRFEAYDWHVLAVDGHDRDAIADAIRQAQAETERPSLIICHTHIAYGSPNKQDTASAHGEPLGSDEVRLTKEALGWPPDTQFLVPDEVLAHFRTALDRGAKSQQSWKSRLARYGEAHPHLASEWNRRMAGELPAGWDASLPSFTPQDGPVATRAVGGKIMAALAPVLPELVGGSADLHPSTKTYLSAYPAVKKGEFGARNLHFGIREHAMGGILNGMALHGGFRPYGSTFLVFSDYMRPSIRLAALMKQPVIYVFTHDSIFVGEDGPTHQPVEHAASLRMIPNLTVFRPADASETVAAWRAIVEHRDGPVALLLTRQKLPVLAEAEASGVAQGGYVMADVENPQVILVASGSEVETVLGAQKILAKEGIGARVVSMPSWKVFDAQPQAYRDSVLLPGVAARVAVEAGVPFGWERYVGNQGEIIALDRFGASAPYKVLAENWGFTPEAVAERIKAYLQRS
ncbi:MAG TPA: transketolase [Anaerolineae bacterium]|nr:transketolase [Anaerolineae bacterium]